jgi:quercetin dioxygenase-like cupin family protein
MTPPKTNAPLPILATPEVVSPELAPLLAEPFAQVWQNDAAQPAQPASKLRERLIARVATSLAAEARLTTVRRQTSSQPLAAGVAAQTLYSAAQGQTLRAGEPQRVRLLTLQAATILTAEILAIDSSLQVDVLVLSGSVQCTGQREALSQRDYHVNPAGHAWPQWHSARGAVLLVREAQVPSQAEDTPHVVWDAQAGWPAFAPGIQRRVLWRRGTQAALLYHAQAGARVPQHNHGHDEECFMVQGELFLDDLLLQAGDYQLAPAGTGHRITETDTGAVLYAHGDISLQFVG